MMTAVVKVAEKVEKRAEYWVQSRVEKRVAQTADLMELPTVGE